MGTCLDPIWNACRTSRHTAKVVERCLAVACIDRERASRNTRFHGLADDECRRLVAGAEAALSDATVSLYGQFESRLREHVLRQSGLLKAATAPNPQFGVDLASPFESQCDALRMDAVADLFKSAVGPAAVHRVATIRAYRHWLAHGRAWAAPSAVDAPFTYRHLTTFLVSAGLS